jgi:acyl carrier protein
MGLDTVELVIAVEETFVIEIPDAEAERLYAVGLLHSFIVSEMGRLGRPAVDPERIYATLRDLICKHLGVKPEAVVPEAEFVRDLGAD